MRAERASFLMDTERIVDGPVGSMSGLGEERPQIEGEGYKPVHPSSMFVPPESNKSDNKMDGGAFYGSKNSFFGQNIIKNNSFDATRKQNMYNESDIQFNYGSIGQSTVRKPVPGARGDDGSISTPQQSFGRQMVDNNAPTIRRPPFYGDDQRQKDFGDFSSSRAFQSAENSRIAPFAKADTTVEHQSNSNPILGISNARPTSGVMPTGDPKVPRAPVKVPQTVSGQFVADGPARPVMTRAPPRVHVAPSRPEYTSDEEDPMHEKLCSSPLLEKNNEALSVEALEKYIAEKFDLDGGKRERRTQKVSSTSQMGVRHPESAMIPEQRDKGLKRPPLELPQVGIRSSLGQPRALLDPGTIFSDEEDSRPKAKRVKPNESPPREKEKEKEPEKEKEKPREEPITVVKPKTAKKKKPKEGKSEPAMPESALSALITDPNLGRLGFKPRKPEPLPLLIPVRDDPNAKQTKPPPVISRPQNEERRDQRGVQNDPRNRSREFFGSRSGEESNGFSRREQSGYPAREESQGYGRRETPRGEDSNGFVRREVSREENSNGFSRASGRYPREESNGYSRREESNGFSRREESNGYSRREMSSGYLSQGDSYRRAEESHGFGRREIRDGREGREMREGREIRERREIREGREMREGHESREVRGGPGTDSGRWISRTRDQTVMKGPPQTRGWGGDTLERTDPPEEPLYKKVKIEEPESNLIINNDVFL
eukprot:TRINITY_DN7638_c0_g1_i9.p1 TRINITY_DN7638_c0_g1~~TRINITY_DN7638_c0_g1_i9.p1  ORF type:complete len:717 (-),score=135.81 TRINITY_DN7638_c0_g1_i9:85-2235(-)